MDPVLEIAEEDFEREYHPTQYDEYADIPKGTSAKNVWTVVEGDYGDLYAVAGLAFVNRLMYVVTEKPWEELNTVAVWHIFEKDEDER